MRSLRTTLAALALLAPPSLAQWSPGTGQWGPSHAGDVRVMTWNVRDTLCSGAAKQAGLCGPWEAAARIVAALRPDVLLLQECGDNDGLTGSGSVDSAATLAAVVDRFLRGGSDPWEGGSVTAYVQLYAPGYDLPYAYVSSETDGFNRNVVLSRFPFADRNGDGKATYADVPSVLPTAYAPGGDGGIRGFGLVELDLPDAQFAGDLVVGNAHLKSGSSAADAADRLEAAQNAAYVLDHWYQGAGLGLGPDPFAKIADSPPAQALLGASTGIVLGGDWNEDEVQNGAYRGPAAWLSEAAVPDGAGGTDGTDRDRSDLRLDGATHLYTGSPNTLGSSKLDYVAWQDSVLGFRRAFTFHASGTPAAALPDELGGYCGGSGSGASAAASDHRPVVVDLVPAPAAVCQPSLGSGGPGTATLSVCGEPLAAGASATLSVTGAVGLVPGFLVVSNLLFPQPFAGGIVLPSPAGSAFAVLAAPTDLFGQVTLTVPGGGGPAALGVQYLHYHPGLPQAIGITNAVQVNFLP